MSTLVPIDDGWLETDVVGNGETILLSHGAVFADGMKPLLGEAALTGAYTVVDYKRRGYGRSSPTKAGAGIRGGADDMAALLDSMTISACHLVGHSFGGYVALEFAARYSNRVRSLTLIDAGPLMVAASAPRLVSGLVGLEELFRSGRGDSVVEILLETLNGAIYRERLDDIFPLGWEGRARTALTTYFDSDVPSALGWQFGPEQAARISARTLSMVGSDSPEVFHETHDLLLDWLPRVEGLTLAGLAHCPHWFDVQRVAQEIAQFLSGTQRL